MGRLLENRPLRPSSHLVLDHPVFPFLWNAVPRRIQKFSHAVKVITNPGLSFSVLVCASGVSHWKRPSAWRRQRVNSPTAARGAARAMNWRGRLANDTANAHAMLDRARAHAADLRNRLATHFANAHAVPVTAHAAIANAHEELVAGA